MLEVIGYYTMRLLGWGWLWGELPPGGVDQVYGNGGGLMLVGFVVIALVAGAFGSVS